MQRLSMPHSVCMQGIISLCAVFIMFSLNFILLLIYIFLDFRFKLISKRLSRISEAYLAGKTHMQRSSMPHSVCMQGIISLCEVFIMFSKMHPHTHTHSNNALIAFAYALTHTHICTDRTHMHSTIHPHSHMHSHSHAPSFGLTHTHERVCTVNVSERMRSFLHAIEYLVEI